VRRRADQYGPRVVATTPGTVTLRFTQPPDSVDVETEARPTRRVASRPHPLERDHLRAGAGDRNPGHVGARGHGWNAVWVVRLDQVAQRDPLRAKVSSVRYTANHLTIVLGGDVGPSGATYSAYVALHGRRVSSIARGPLTIFGLIKLTLHRGQAHNVRNGGLFVLTLAAGAQHKTVRVKLK
jgi:hypothetical protein